MTSKVPFSSKYRRFFAANLNERHVFLQGGRRSGKTFATFLFLAILTSFIVTSGEAASLTVMVVCNQYSQLQATMIDFEKAIGVPVVGNKTLGDHARTCNGRVLWQFKSFDNPTKVQGTQCDFTFFNEAVNIPEDIARVQMMSTRLQCYYNFNPTRKFWGQSYYNGTNVFCTTFKDNKHLTDEQRGEFEAIKEKAMKPTARKIDLYQYKVYYLGEFADMVGNVFGQVETCTAADYFQIPAQEFIGMDFGFATDGDPTTVIGVKVHNRRIYVHEYIYQVGLTSNFELVFKLKAAGINGHTPIFADHGGMGRSRMDDLIRNHGMSIYNAQKTTILDGVNMMLTYDGITVTDCSKSTRDEFEGYEFDENQKPHGADHAIDAARYAFNQAYKRQ
jgi:phage terminase large subunit